MGGGASKDEGADKKAEEPPPTSPSRRNSANAPPPKDKGPQVQRLVCTVEDAKRNQFVPFVSSIHNGGSEPDLDIDFDDVDSTDSTDSSSDAQKFVFGEVSIDTHVETSDVSQKSKTLSMSSPTSPSSSVFQRPLAAADTDVRIHGVNVAADPWRNAKVVCIKPAKDAVGVQMGDLQVLGVDPRKQTVSAWFCTPTRHAIPYKYTFTAFAAQPGPIRGLSASSEGTQVAVVVSGVKQCFLIDLKGTLLMSVKGHLDPVLSCAQSKDGKFLVTTSADCTAVMWDLNNGKKLRELPVSTQVNSVTISDESDAIATTSTDDVVHLWDSKSCDPLIMFQRHTAGVFSIAFSRRGNLIASGSSNGEIYVWSQQNGEVKNFLAKHKTPVLALSFSHDGQRLVSVDRETLRVWDLFTGHCIFCRDTKGGLTFGVDEDHGKSRHPIEDTARYTCCSFVAGNLVATALTSKQLLLLDPNEGKELLMIPTKALVTSLSCAWMGDVIFVGDFAGNLYKWELHFSARDIQAFHLDAKPPTKEKKNASLDKD